VRLVGYLKKNLTVSVAQHLPTGFFYYALRFVWGKKRIFTGNVH